MKIPKGVSDTTHLYFFHLRLQKEMIKEDQSLIEDTFFPHKKIQNCWSSLILRPKIIKTSSYPQ